MLHGTNSKISDVLPCTDLTDLDIFHAALIVDRSDRSVSLSELNKLSVVHFKGSARLTQFSLAEHKLYRAVSWSAIYKLFHGSNFKL